MIANELREVVGPLTWAIVCAGAIAFLNLCLSAGILIALLREHRGVKAQLVDDARRLAEFTIDYLDGSPRAEFGENVRDAAERIERRFPARW